MSIIIGIDHGYYAIKTAHCSFPAGLTSYGEHEPYTRQGLLEFGGCFFVCGSGRQPIQRNKTANDMRDVVQICEPGGRILDPFAGAGTTVLAAVQEGYEAVGIEMSDAYFQRSTERLKTALESEVNQN